MKEQNVLKMSTKEFADQFDLLSFIIPDTTTKQNETGDESYCVFNQWRSEHWGHDPDDGGRPTRGKYWLPVTFIVPFRGEYLPRTVEGALVEYQRLPGGNIGLVFTCLDDPQILDYYVKIIADLKAYADSISTSTEQPPITPLEDSPGGPGTYKPSDAYGDWTRRFMAMSVSKATAWKDVLADGAYIALRKEFMQSRVEAAEEYDGARMRQDTESTLRQTEHSKFDNAMQRAWNASRTGKKIILPEVPEINPD